MKQVAIGSVVLAFAVALGAFGAHGLTSLVSESALRTFETGVRYQMYHGFAIVLCGVLNYITNSNVFRWPSQLFLIGLMLFSGSIYILTFREYAEALKWAGPITPVGGLFLISAWLVTGRRSLQAFHKP